MSQPLPNLVFNTFEDACKNTPDFLKLKHSSTDEFPVLIFGTLQKNRIFKDKMHGCKYYGKAKTYNAKFIAKQSPSNRGALTSDPYVFCSAGVSEKLIKKEGLEKIFDDKYIKHLEGDMYGVPLRKLTELDTHHSNQDGFERIKTWCKLIDPIQEGAAVEAWVYVVDIDYFLDVYTADAPLYNCNTIGYQDPVSGMWTTHYTF